MSLLFFFKGDLKEKVKIKDKEKQKKKHKLMNEAKKENGEVKILQKGTFH